jgi:polyisoprenoid-binding protein YceI
MRLSPGRHELGPDEGTLSVRTGRRGAAAMAGHDLLLHVTTWRGTLEVGEDSSLVGVALDADATSLRVREGTGGAKTLDDDDRANIEQTIDDEVLKGHAIEFRSTSVHGDGAHVRVEGDLTLVGTARPLAFEVDVDEDGVLRGSAVVRQSAWGMKPYSAFFGTLKVADEVEVSLEARVPSTAASA